MKRVGECDRNATIWRYLTIDKFASLLQTRALWFSKLQILQDQREGMMPAAPRAALKRQHRKTESWFPDEERRAQVRNFVEANENDGRELIVVNCWFVGDHESQAMWDEYARDSEGNCGVIVKSTADDLLRSLRRSHDNWWFGNVKYVDLATDEGMNAYQASQASLRAFLKNQSYSHESELRLATMNFVTPGCLNPDGSPPTERQRAGYSYSSDRRGIFVEVDLHALIREMRVAPGATGDHHAKMEELRLAAGIETAIGKSKLS